MLVELNMLEQRDQAVLEVTRDGATVVEVARRSGVTRQTVHAWLKRYAAGGLTGLADVPSKPDSCPHQMPPEVEAKLLELRREHPGWGPRTLGQELGQAGVVPVPGRSSIYRCLVRHGLITPEARKRKRSDYKRWERSRAMELWQMDIVGGVKLVDGSEAKIVSGIDDHSRFIVSALVVERATARPTCDALALAMRRFGVPAEILTDNGKVFTGRFGRGTVRCCLIGCAGRKEEVDRRSNVSFPTFQYEIQWPTVWQSVTLGSRQPGRWVAVPDGR